jgi:nucleoside-diphosphate-sugar epimerase
MVKRVLITGGGGFVGANLAHQLVERGDEVHVCVRPDGDLWRLQELRGRIYVHAVDLGQRDPVLDLVSDLRPQWVVNCAVGGGFHPRTDDQRQGAMECNVLGTFHLLEAVRAAGSEKFVQLSSSLEYGPQSHPLTESSPLEPITFRGMTKAAATLACLQAARTDGVPVVCLRVFSVYGAWESGHRLIPTAIRAAQNDLTMRLTRSGFRRDLIHIDDVLRAIVLAAETHGGLGEAINIGTGRQTSNERVIEAVEAATDRKIRIQPGEYPASPSDTGHWCADIAKAELLLGWRPEVSVAEGLRRTAIWFRNNEHLYRETSDGTRR